MATTSPEVAAPWTAARRAGRRLLRSIRALLRWGILMVLLLPGVLADAFTHSGLSGLFRAEAIDGLAEHMGPEGGPSPDVLHQLLDRHLTQAWLDGQIGQIARQLLDGWQAASWPCRSRLFCSCC